MFDRRTNLEKQLAKANDRLKAAIAAIAPKHKGGEMEEFQAAHQAVLQAERDLADSKGEPHAVPFNFPVKWDIGAPSPFLLCSEHRAFLTFYVSERDANWDGTYVKVIDPASTNTASLCLVTFNGYASAKFGHPNDEVLSGHPLAKRGLEGYTAQIVKNSPWLREVAKTNSVHRGDRPESWAALNHYVFWFHDSTFECLAKSYEVELTSESMPDLLNRVRTMLLQ
jgi:hypothetical protein